MAFERHRHNIPWHVLLTLVTSIGTVSSLYFPLADLELVAPPLRPAILLKVTARQDDGRETESGTEYQVSGRPSWLWLDSASHELRLTGKQKELDSEVINVTAKDKYGTTAHMKIKVTILSSKEVSRLCVENKEALCFWTGVEYQVYENSIPTPLGPLGPSYLLDLCPENSVSYQLLSSNTFVQILNGSLWSKENLDRDGIQKTRSENVHSQDRITGPRFQEEILCSVKRQGNVSTYNRTVNVTVQDVNDNPPRSTSHEPEIIYLDNKGYIPKVNVTLLFNMGPERPPQPPPPPSAPLYPNQTFLLRHAKKGVRVLQPSQGPNLTSMSSQLAESSPIFNITSTAGIVYVQNETALQEANDSVQLELQWRYDSSETWNNVNVTVFVDEGRAPVCHKNKTRKKRPLCSSQANKTDCMNLCGAGTGKRNFTNHGVRGNILETTSTGGCAWREPVVPEQMLTTQYSTCTTDLETCPDEQCDPLEERFPFLCPQDCIDKKNAHGRPIPDKNVRGIYKGHGVCTCEDSEYCSCHERITASNLTSAVPSASTTPDSNGPSAKKADPRGSCGVGCKLGVIVGSLFLIGGTIGFIFWRYRLSGKGRRDRNFMGSVASLSAVQSDYVDRSLQPSDVQVMTSPRASPDPRTTPDPKWEFPRSRLVIEQTLGEGEFGRVLRARAMDIGGTTGYTTVAVKTLKEDASASELADLLSEYQLLKEVSHPNVVRLLGACTMPGGPVYLIIEFAEHGSLRNYLRKSRHLESDGQIPCSFDPGTHPAEMPPMPAPATPRDILCFAWQISKGMTYLSEIKLVHRDLAARNVLVGAGKVCKISDFGLTRDVYEDNAYLKRSKGRVPVKWMALESLADHMYTSKSDVWSFGVLMWELVTLGASPYPGVAVHNLFHLLRAGYRMERPENCSSQLYRVMRSCWHEDASERPSFKELTAIFERMLEDGVEYLDLNPRIVHNRTYFTSLSSSQDLLDDDDVGYGNLNILPTDSVNYLTPHQRQLQTSSSRMPLLSTGDEEQRLLTPPADFDKTSDQADVEKQEESPRLGNAYLSPIRQPSSLNRISNDSSAVNSGSVSLTQSYVNMTIGQPKRGSSQDLLVSTSPVTSKATTPF